MVQPPSRLVIIFFVLLGTAVALAQQASPQASSSRDPFDVPLTTMAEIKARRVAPETRVRIRAILAWQRGAQVYLVSEQGQDAQVNTLRAPWPSLRAGDMVELAGSVIPGTATAFLDQADIRVLGRSALPTPARVEIEDVRAYKNTSDWVALEGVIDSWFLSGGTLEVVVQGPRESLMLRVPDYSAAVLPQALHGARARFTCITRRLPRGTYAYVPSPSFFEILMPGISDRYEAPEHAAVRIATGQVPAGELVRTRGVLLHQEKELLYVRAPGAALCVRLPSRPWRDQAGPSSLFSDNAPPSGLMAGDELEIVGTHVLATANPAYVAFDLRDATVRVVGHQEQPVEPVAATLGAVAAGAHNADLVQFSGRVLALQQVPAGMEWRTTLLLQAEGEKLPVVYQGRQISGFDQVRPDYEVLVTGIVHRATPESPRQLWLNEASHVRILGISPEVVTHRLWMWASIGGLVVAALLGWIVVLRRSRRTAVRNAAELKAASEAARESEQRWKLLFEQSPLSVQMFHPDGQTKRFNQAWKNLFRLNDEQGHAFNVLKDPDLNASGAVNLIRKAFEGEVVHVPPVPFPVNTDPPEVRWIGGVLYPVKNEAGQIIEVVTIHNDITEMKRAEEAMRAINHTLEKRVEERTAELQQAQGDLQRALEQERDLGELKTRFVTMVSHEFRTPLGIIMSSVELLQHYSDRLPEDEKTRQLQEIQSSTKHMGGLMEQVLLLGRAEAGKLTCKPRPLDLAAFAERIIDETHSISNRKCPIMLLAEGDLHGALVDETLLRHIMSNLVGNAVKYSPEGSEVMLRLRREGPNAAIVVSDRGIGIPAKDRDRLFEAFHRCSNVGDTPGTGLGLVIMKRCVDLHGGTISIDSEPGRGTTFTVRLPVFTANDLPEP